MSAPRIGLIDIETAPISAWVWKLFDENISLDQITGEWAILSFCYMPLQGSKKDIVYYDNCAMRDPRDDTELCERLWHILNDNDFLIAQNGKRFDMRKIKARLLMHGFPPPSPCKVIDTMLMARSVAAFTSNKLEWLSKYLSRAQKSKHKEFPGFSLWAECLAGNPKAWASLRRYNIPDVLSMKEVYLKLRPWVNTHPNIVVYTDDERVACPVCGGHKIEQDGFSFTNVGKYLRYHCLAKNCGAWSRSRYTLNSKDKRRSLLAAQ